MSEVKYVKPHRRAGRFVKGYFRRIGQSFSREMKGRKDGVHVDSSEGVVSLELDDVTYNKIKAGVDSPRKLLIESGLTKDKIMELVREQGFDGRGMVMVKNRSSGDMMKVKLFDFTDPRIPMVRSDLQPLSREIVE